MANKDVRFGLKPVEQGGGDYTGHTSLYFAPSGYGTDLFIGDPVTITGTANTAVVRDHGIGTMPEVNVSGVGDAVVISAVIVGFEPVTQDDNVYGTLSTERVIHCVDDPTVIFEIQADGAIPATSIGLNAVLIATHGGSTVTGMSGMELDTTSAAPAANASNQLTILRAVDRLDNDTTITHSKVLVRITNHTNVHGVIGIDS